jgi:hypothetical protein
MGRGGRHHQGRGQGPSLTVTADNLADDDNRSNSSDVEMQDAVTIDDTATKGRGNRPMTKGRDKEEEDEEATDSFPGWNFNDQRKPLLQISSQYVSASQ